jgi:type III pantothenate kinase
MTSLTIDIGNSSIKYALFDNQSMIHYQRIMGHDIEQLADEVANYHPTHSIVCATISLTEQQQTSLSKLTKYTEFLTHTTAIPIHNQYKSPETLGMDRLAAAVGAYMEVKKDVLIIDMGTAITYDFVDKEGNYRGGNIAPGLQMRLKALHDYTSRLPYVEAEGPHPELGENTETAIRCGVIDGIRYEIEGYLRQFFLKYHNLSVFFTGGDELYFEDEIKKRIFADKFLVVKGLNYILRYKS